MSDHCGSRHSKEEAPLQGAEVDCGKPEKELTELTPAEFRVYNRLAEHMDYFVRIYHLN